MTSSRAPQGRIAMDEDVVAGQDPGHVALEEVEDGQAQTAGVLAGGVLEVIEKGDGLDEAPGVGLVACGRRIPW